MHELDLLVQVSEEFIKFSVNALSHAVEHDGDEHRQRQLAAPDGGVSGVGLAGMATKLPGVQEYVKLGEQ